MVYKNKYGKIAICEINKAFLNYCITKEISDKWSFRLLNDYKPYLKERQPNEPGFFYSKEINHLLKTGHYFSKYKISFYYEVYYR